MKLIGLLMFSHEDDILAEVVASHAEIVDLFYALDGTVPNTDSKRICGASPKCAGYLTDAELGPRFPDKPTDGYRQALYEQAAAEHGFDNWFLLLHGDEVWTFDPRPLTDSAADGFVFDLPFFFPRAWDETRPPLEQLHWRLGPGWPELRMFRGGTHVRYQESQHFDVRPLGLRQVVRQPEQINHYLYRSPASQRARAQRHLASGFDPDNYRHVLDDDKVLWDEALITSYRQRPQFRELACV